MCTFPFSFSTFSKNCLLIWNSHAAVSVTSIISEWAERLFLFFPIHLAMSIKQTSNDSLSVIKNWNSHAETLGVGGVLWSMWKTDLSNAGRPFPANEHMLDESANILSLCQGYWVNIPRILKGISGRIFGKTLKQTLIRSLNFLGVPSCTEASTFLHTSNCASFLLCE